MTMQRFDLSPKEAQRLLSQLREYLRAEHKESTIRAIAAEAGCSSAAVSQWQTRGISGLRAQWLNLKYPNLPIWYEKKVTEANNYES